MENEKLATELLHELKASSRRWFYAFVVMTVLEICTIAGFLWYISLSGDGISIKSEDGGIANYTGYDKYATRNLEDSSDEESEKSNVSSDTQLCGSIQTAFVTALADPLVNDATTYKTEVNTLSSPVDVSTALNQSAVGSAMKENLGVTNATELSSSLKSFGASSIAVQIKWENSVSVWLPGTDASGSKGRNSFTSSIISVD